MAAVALGYSSRKREVFLLEQYAKSLLRSNTTSSTLILVRYSLAIGWSKVSILRVYIDGAAGAPHAGADCPLKQ